MRVTGAIVEIKNRIVFDIADIAEIDALRSLAAGRPDKKLTYSGFAPGKLRGGDGSAIAAAVLATRPRN